MDPKYAGMMGYTEEELKLSFNEHVETIVQKRSQQAPFLKKKKSLMKFGLGTMDTDSQKENYQFIIPIPLFAF